MSKKLRELKKLKAEYEKESSKIVNIPNWKSIELYTKRLETLERAEAFNNDEMYISLSNQVREAYKSMMCDELSRTVRDCTRSSEIEKYISALEEEIKNEETRIKEELMSIVKKPFSMTAFLLGVLVILVVIVLATGCEKETNTPVDIKPTPAPTVSVPTDEIKLGQKITLWATYYYTLKAEKKVGVLLRDMQGKSLGVSLTAKDWCSAAMEGAVAIDHKVYNYAGVGSTKEADCSPWYKHAPSEKVRWKAVNSEYGLGNKSNHLVPYVTIACDQGTVSNSSRWLNGGFMKFGQRIFIPEAKGVKLPDGKTHDGIFQCGDTGGKITSNHIDVFIGFATSDSNAKAVNPFSFIKSSSKGTFTAYLVD